MSSMKDTKDIMTLGLIAFGGYILLTKVINPLGTFFGKKTDKTDCGLLDPWCESSHKCMSQTDHLAGLCLSDKVTPPPTLPKEKPGDPHHCVEGMTWCEALLTCIPQDAKCTGIVITPPPPTPPPPVPSPNPNQMIPRSCSRTEKWCAPISMCVNKNDACVGYQGEDVDGMINTGDEKKTAEV